jgi:hypothetical protein
MKTMKALLVAALLGVGATSVAMAQRPHLGFRAGYNFDFDDAAIGAQVLVPIGSMVEFYPSFDYYFRDTGSAVGFNADLKLRGNSVSSVLYVGGGLNMLRTSVSGANDMNTGGNLFVGVESRLGQTHPFFEVRGLLREQSSVQLVGGFNFTLP